MTEEQKLKANARQRRWYARHKDREVERRIRYKNSDPIRYVLQHAKNNAKERGCEFNLTREDIIIPERCPILDVPLIFGGKFQKGCSPSVDRVDNTKGYVKGNVRIISCKANHLKSDMTKETIQRLHDYVFAAR